MSILDHYVIERADDSGFTTNVQTYTPVTGSSYEDTTGTNFVTYYYRIKAVDTDGNSSAWSPTVSGAKTPALTNWALAGTATASATASNFSPSAAINGVRHPNNQWGTAGTYATGNGWDAGVNPSVTPQWLQVDLGSAETISEVDVITLADAINYNTNPTLADTFGSYGIVDYKVQSSPDASTWTDRVTVTANNKVWRQHTLAGISARYWRVYVTTSQGGDARIVEFEVKGY